MMKDEKGLVIREQSFDITPIEFLKQQTRQLEELYRGLMQEGTDYGKVPGTDKPTLFKSGAELLRLRAKLDPKFVIDNSGTDLISGVFNYQVTCDLYRDGEHIGAGVGSCNSLESKYRYRWVFESALPKGIDKATLPSKKFQSKGRWYITYRIENENPQDLANTILKMAKKRAFVDAILTVTGASRIFTQDVEDMVDEIPAPSEHKEEPKKAKGEYTESPAYADKKVQETLRDSTESTARPFDESVKAETQGEGFINLDDLRDKIKQAKWTIAQVVAWLKGEYPELDVSGKFVDIMKRVNREQAEVLLAEIESRISMA